MTALATAPTYEASDKELKMADNKAARRFARVLDRIEAGVPKTLGRALGALRRPGAMPLRVPVALLLVTGGVFSFLPVLGLWMLPLGLLLLAIDVAILRGPLAVGIIRLRRWWAKRRRRRSKR